MGVRDDRKMFESRMEEFNREWRDLFGREWRKFIHLANDPAFILNEKYYLIEVNEAGRKLFPKMMRLPTKTHLLDLFRDSEMKNGILGALAEADKKRGVIVRYGFDQWQIVIFTPECLKTGVAYTVLCSRTSSSGFDRRIHV